MSEANVYNANGTYCACHLVGTGEPVLTTSFAPDQTEPVVSHLPFQTPWRAILIASSLDVLTDSTLICNLNPPSQIEDVSWIHPSRNIWDWWAFDTGAQQFTAQKRQVDFAAAMGFESVTVDAAWDSTWVKELCNYARARRVSIWIWTAKKTLGTRDAAEHLIPLWASWGIAGLKVDFFISDSQYTMWQYNMIAEIAARNHLMLNYHG